MNDLNMRALRSSVLGTITLAALIFLPAGTLHYWQGWVFMAVFVGATGAITVHLAIKDPALLERRMRAGPRAEHEPAQKFIMGFMMFGFCALAVLPACDHRCGWSQMPGLVCCVGAALMAAGFLCVFRVLNVNPYGASTIQVAEGQAVISSGPYARVRHPMYAGAMPLLVGMPMTLGSWWGLAVLMPLLPTLIWRLLDEERFLTQNLPGYAAYCEKVRFRLIPFVW